MWKVGSPLPAIEQHSNAKLNLLELYLRRYFDVVTADPRQDKLAISFIDGFSGGGAYQDARGEERAGSPFILLRSVRQAEAAVNLRRHKPFSIDAKFYFVELNRESYLHLQHMISKSEFADWLSEGRIVIQHGEFERVCPTILQDIRDRHHKGRSVFLLDQKGWSEVQFSTIRGILTELPRAEVLLTFAVDWLISYINDSPEFEKPMVRAGFSPSDIRRYCEAKGESGYRYVIPRLLREDIQRLTGAPFFTPFFLRSSEASRDLWIIHLSKLTRARNVMVETHWDISNAATYAGSSLHQGTAGLNMLGFDPHWEGGLALDFAFDEMADRAISKALLRHLPEAVRGVGSTPPTLDVLVSRLANDTAATEGHIQAALKELHDARELEILTPSGARKRGPGPLAKGDRIHIPRQGWLLPRNNS